MKTSTLSAILAACTLSLSSLASTPAQAQNPGTLVSGTGLCLDVARSEMGKKGGRVLAWECHGGENQQWTIQGKRGAIRSSTGMCLDASRSNMHKNGAKVMIWDCHGGPNQNWVFAGQGIRNGSGLCLDISRSSLRDSGGRKGKIILWDCHFKTNQQWAFQSTALTPEPSPGFGIAPEPKKKSALPHVSSIPPGQPTALDGIWKLAANNIPYKIEAGRMYTMADYMHLFIFPVETYDVVVKDIVQTGPGQLSGNDLALLGPWTAQLQGNGTIKVSVQGALGPFESRLTPVQVANPEWLAQEVAAIAGGGFVQPPAPIRPGPPLPRPSPTPQPPQDHPGDIQYPPGWGN